MGLDLDRVSDDTNIAKRFLSALEEENFTVFPGDPYVMGFIRNYAEYLGLEPRELISGLQEHPNPGTAGPGGGSLIPETRTLSLDLRRRRRRVVLAVVAVACRLPWETRDPPPGNPRRNPRSGLHRQYILEEPVLEMRFYEGDTVLIPLGDQKYRTPGRQDRPTGWPWNPPSAAPCSCSSEKGTLDLDKDTMPELRIFVNDFQKGDPSRAPWSRLTADRRAVRRTWRLRGCRGPRSGRFSGRPRGGPSRRLRKPRSPANLKTTVLFDKVSSPSPSCSPPSSATTAMFRLRDGPARPRGALLPQGRPDQRSTPTNAVKLWTSQRRRLQADDPGLGRPDRPTWSWARRARSRSSRSDGSARPTTGLWSLGVVPTSNVEHASASTSTAAPRTRSTPRRWPPASRRPAGCGSRRPRRGRPRHRQHLRLHRERQEASPSRP
ncbi:MAG: helix-turn-helix domain-containing protein [Marinilabiliales bacterium]|nr:helix-turn-helix domain-containing protein [Marinilabiliales bacterium]